MHLSRALSRSPRYFYSPSVCPRVQQQHRRISLPPLKNPLTRDNLDWLVKEVKEDVREARGFLSQELDELKQRDPLSLTYIRSLPTFAEKRQAVFRIAKQFARIAWSGLKLLVQQTRESLSKDLRTKVETMKCTRAEYMEVYRNRKDWRKILPILFWMKALPFGGLYVPFVLLLFPNLLPSTFAIAEIAHVSSPYHLFDQKVRLKRIHYLAAVPLDAVESRAESIAFFYRRHISSTDVLNNEGAFAEVPLETLSVAQLKALRLAVGGRAFTIDFWPKFYLIRKMRAHFAHIAKDDALLLREGVASLSKLDLEEACMERGLHIRDLSEPQLRQQLSEWLDIARYKPRLAKALFVHAHSVLYTNLTLEPERDSDWK